MYGSFNIEFQSVLFYDLEDLAATSPPNLKPKESPMLIVSTLTLVDLNTTVSAGKQNIKQNLSVLNANGPMCDFSAHLYRA